MCWCPGRTCSASTAPASKGGGRVNVSATGLAVAFAAGVVVIRLPVRAAADPRLPVVSGRARRRAAARPAAGAVIATIAFTAGFTAVFTLAGAGVGLVGGQFVDHRRGLELAGGILVIAMGVVMIVGGPLSSSASGGCRSVRAAHRARRGGRRRGVRGRLVALHRPDAGEHPGDRRGPGPGDRRRRVAGRLLARPRPPVDRRRALSSPRWLEVAAPIRPYLGTVSARAGAAADLHRRAAGERPAREISPGSAVELRHAVKVVSVVGNRPQFIKAAPLSPRARRRCASTCSSTPASTTTRALAGVLRRARAAAAGPRIGGGSGATPIRRRA